MFCVLPLLYFCFLSGRPPFENLSTYHLRPHICCRVTAKKGGKGTNNERRTKRVQRIGPCLPESGLACLGPPILHIKIQSIPKQNSLKPPGSPLNFFFGLSLPDWRNPAKHQPTGCPRHPGENRFPFLVPHILSTSPSCTERKRLSLFLSRLPISLLVPLTRPASLAACEAADFRT